MSAKFGEASFGRSNTHLTVDIHFECDWCGATETGFTGISIDLWISEGYWDSPALPEDWRWMREPQTDHRNPTLLICNQHEAVLERNWQAGAADGRELRRKREENDA